MEIRIFIAEVETIVEEYLTAKGYKVGISELDKVNNPKKVIYEDGYFRALVDLPEAK